VRSQKRKRFDSVSGADARCRTVGAGG